MNKKINSDWLVLGHKNIIEYLTKSVSREKMSHAYIFIGPEGVGKKLVALNFINIILEKDKKNQNIINFNNLGSNELYANLQKNPDIHFVAREESKSLISIEQIRKLIHDLSLKNFRATYKFALIDHAELLSNEASNSFLKTLEEPSNKTIIILLTSRESSIPETIKSRCQIIRFNPVDKEEIYQYLKDIKLSPQLANNLSLLSQGKPGMAIKFSYEQELYENYRQTVDDFIELFKSGIPKRFSIINSLKNQITKSNNNQDEIQKILSIWLAVLRDMLLSKINLQNRLIHLYKKEQYQKLIKEHNCQYYTNLINHLMLATNLIKRNLNYNLVLENFILKI